MEISRLIDLTGVSNPVTLGCAAEAAYRESRMGVIGLGFLTRQASSIRRVLDRCVVQDGVDVPGVCFIGSEVDDFERLALETEARVISSEGVAARLRSRGLGFVTLSQWLDTSGSRSSDAHGPLNGRWIEPPPSVLGRPSVRLRSRAAFSRNDGTLPMNPNL